MSAKTEKFLSLYRTYEGLVRAEGLDPKDLEQSMSVSDGSKMVMARQFRNFLSHAEAPGYLEPTDAMISFLEKQVKARQMQGDVAKKHLKAAASSTCGPKETCAEAVGKLAKLKRTKIAVAGKDGEWFAADIWTLASMACGSKSAKASLAKPLREKILFVSPAEPVKDILGDRLVLCTDDGTASGKVLGTVVL